MVYAVLHGPAFQLWLGFLFVCMPLINEEPCPLLELFTLIYSCQRTILVIIIFLISQWFLFFRDYQLPLIMWPLQLVVGVLFVCVTLTDAEPHPVMEECRRIDSCRCQAESGIIDLSPLDSKNYLEPA